MEARVAGSRGRYRVNPRTRFQITTLVMPVILFELGLKCARIAELYRQMAEMHGPTSWETLQFLGSDLCGAAAYGLFCAGVLKFMSDRKGETAALIALQCFSVILLVLNTVAHTYFAQTGSTVSWPMFVYTIPRLHEVANVTAGVVPIGLWIALGLSSAAVIVGPWVAPKVKTTVSRWRGSQAVLINTRAEQRLRGIVLCVVSTVLGTIGLMPMTERVDIGVAREPLLRLVASAFWYYHESSKALHSDPGNFSSPIALAPSVSAGSLRNVVIVLLESTRAESVTPYNPSLQTTPFLAELATKSLIAERAYAVIPHTSKSLVAVLCGMEPAHSVRTVSAERGFLESRCIASLLRQQGYHSVFFQSARSDFESRPQLINNIGFEDFFPLEKLDTRGFERANRFGYEDDILLEPTRHWLQAHRDRPFVAAYLTVTPHQDYQAPSRYGRVQFTGQDVLNRYLNCIRYQDFFIRNLLDVYRSLGLYENTLFVFVGDHGEGFGDHMQSMHDDDIYEETLRVPLIIHDPKGDRVRPGRVVNPVNQLDILPTVLIALGFKWFNGHLDGRNLARPFPTKPLMAACYNDQRCLVLVDGNMKYIHYYGQNRDELYNVIRDRNERKNIANEYPMLIKSLKRGVEAWHDRIAAAWFSDRINRGIAGLPWATKEQEKGSN